MILSIILEKKIKIPEIQAERGINNVISNM